MFSTQSNIWIKISILHYWYIETLGGDDEIKNLRLCLIFGSRSILLTIVTAIDGNDAIAIHLLL